VDGAAVDADGLGNLGLGHVGREIELTGFLLLVTFHLIGLVYLFRVLVTKQAPDGAICVGSAGNALDITQYLPLAAQDTIWREGFPNFSLEGGLGKVMKFGTQIKQIELA